MPEIRCKRVYDPVEPGDGLRVLADRLWPRGMSKQTAPFDLWAKHLAPSTGLRQQFDHQAQHWPAFCRAYAKELAGQGDAMDALLQGAGAQPITLLFAARDCRYNNAVALRRILQQHCSKPA